VVAVFYHNKADRSNLTSEVPCMTVVQ